MGKIDAYRVDNATPVVTFENSSGERFLTLSGTRVFSLGIGCDTCAFLFQRRGYVHRLSPADVAEHLRSDRGLLDPELLRSIAALLPSDTYGVVETTITPVESAPCAPNDYFSHESVAFFGLDTTWGIPDTPLTRYWRAGQTVLPAGAGADRSWWGRTPSPQRFFHFVVPMEPPHVLDRDRVDFYRSRLADGDRPAAVGVSVLDVRAKAGPSGPRADPDLGDGVEWCLTTFLLDGHHKTQAAAEAGRPLRLLTWIARNASVAREGDVSAVMEELAAWAART